MGEKRTGSKRALLMSFMLVGLVFENLLTPVACRSPDQFANQKNYYSPDPRVRSSPPKHSHKTPSCTPSHGGGGSYNPPTPSHGGGGYYNSPPTSPVIEPPTPTSPIVFTPPTPTTPIISTPPSPLTPIISTPPSPPSITDPSSPPTDPSSPPFVPAPGTYNYWSTHPALIWGLFGYWGTVGTFFGMPATTPFGRNLSLQEALANTRSDGIGALFREGTASFLNSMVNKKFPFTTQEVKDAFTSAIASEKAAAAQAQLFKRANEGHRH